MLRSGSIFESKIVKLKCKIKIKLKEMLLLFICICVMFYIDYIILMIVKDFYDILDF